jgi:HPt (histidine-containing phosphotransfer) domain-containing protein
VRETSKTIEMIDALCEKCNACTDEEIKKYVISVHGMKSSLANIGEPELSAVAAKLEKAGRDKNKELIFSETPAFLDSLQLLVKKLAPPRKEKSNEAANDDLPYLREKMLVVKTACSQYDIGIADSTITEIRKKAWSSRFEEPLNKIAECLLHSDFDEAISVVENTIKLINSALPL